jgi:hypothetical protein
MAILIRERREPIQPIVGSGGAIVVNIQYNCPNLLDDQSQWRKIPLTNFQSNI